MTWYYWAFLSAALTAAASLTFKKTLFSEHALEFAATLSLFTAAFSLPFLFTIDYSTVRAPSLAILFFVAILGTIAFWLMMKSMRHLNISIVSPMRMMGTGMTPLFALVFLREALTPPEWFGIGLIMVGVYFLQKNTTLQNSLIAPQKQTGYIHLIIIAMVIYSITSVLGRFVFVTYSFDPTAWVVLYNIMVVPLFLALLYIFGNGFADIKHAFKTSWPWFVLGAVFTVFYRIAGAFAINAVSVGLAVAIIETAPFFNIVIGGRLFHEENLLKKFTASFVMFVGVVLVLTQ